MKKIIFSFCFILLHAQNGITYQLNGGRFGDNLYNLVRALWLSYKHGLTFEYTPFNNSNLLTIDTIYPLKRSYHQKIHFKHENELENRMAQINNCLFVQDFFIAVGDIYAYKFEYPEFDALMQKVLAPKPSDQLQLEKSSCQTVAVHIRKPSGNDPGLYSKQFKDSLPSGGGAQCSDKRHPAKFPPNQYYIDQITNLSEFLGNPPLQVYIFTDDAHPQALVNSFKEKIKKENLTFISFDDNKSAYALIRDYSLMTQCDYFIRSHSYFSYLPMVLGHHKIIIMPEQWKWENNFLDVCKIRVIFNNENSFEKVEADTLLELKTR